MKAALCSSRVGSDRLDSGPPASLRAFISTLQYSPIHFRRWLGVRRNSAKLQDAEATGRATSRGERHHVHALNREVSIGDRRRR